MVGATPARWGPTLYGVFEFANERSLTGQISRASIFVDIDLDNNPTTGFQALKDFQFEWDVLDVFLPGVCGRFFGFHTTAILGDSILDDGNFAYAYSALASEDSTFGINGVWADPVPLSGSFVANLVTPGPPTSRASPPPPNRVWPPQQRQAPLIRLLRWLRGR